MKYRVIEEKEGIFYVQQRVGFFFKSWEYLNKYGIPLDWDHDLVDATPIAFNSLEKAIEFMEKEAFPTKKDNFKIRAWID